MLLLFYLLVSFLQVAFIWRTILLENREPGKTVAWLFILSLFPVLGILLYMVFGRKTQGTIFKYKHIPNSRLAAAVHHQKHGFNLGTKLSRLNIESEQKLATLLLHSGFAPMTNKNRIDILLNGGEKFQELFNAMEEAKDHIHLSYYIFKDDEIGADVLKILSRKATEGVEVRVLLDGMGSLSVSGSFMRSMRQEGIQAEWFFPLRFPFLSCKLNFRYHRKIVVIDGLIGFIGGLNIGDEYLSRDAKKGFWRDTHLKLEGDSVHSLQAIFLNDWYYVTHQEIQGVRFFPQVNIPENIPVQIIASGPDSNWSANLQGFIAAIAMAKDMVLIETPYFIPDESLIMALKTAALSGLEVRLIVQGIPDHKLTYWAMHSYFEELLQTGVKIFNYVKGTLHAKIFLIDDFLSSVGSTNLDLRSFYLDFEICAFIYDHSLNQRLKQDFERDLIDCKELFLQDFQARPILDRYKESSSRMFSPLF